MSEYYRIYMRRTLIPIILVCVWLQILTTAEAQSFRKLSELPSDKRIAGFILANLYTDADGAVVGAKFIHAQTGAVVFLLQIETVPQFALWVDTPNRSNKGLAHSLEHLLVGKGTKGRYLRRIEQMRFSQMNASTQQDFNFFQSSSEDLEDFFDVFHAYLDAIFRPDFTDIEAEKEFYHFGVTSDPVTKNLKLVEQGTVYNEMQPRQEMNLYYYSNTRLALGEENPFAFVSGGAPNEMRSVTPEAIREFHREHYHLGPETGFIFTISRTANVSNFLQQIGREFASFSDLRASQLPDTSLDNPKYSITSSNITKINLYPFPSATETSPGQILLTWKPVKVESQVELKLLQLLFRAMADGQQSVLYRSLVDSKTRELDLGATAVESEAFLGESPHFPVWHVNISGTPGNRLSEHAVEQVRQLVLRRVQEIAQYGDLSKDLSSFNQIVAADADSWHRSEAVWCRTPPGFGAANSSWKEHLEYLEMDRSFVRSLSEESIWQVIEQQLSSGKNIWRDLVDKFHLLDTPYASASIPSPPLLGELERSKQDRIRAKIDELMKRYQTDSEQKALELFNEDESAKAKDIENIDAQTRQPRLSKHPPMTPDDTIRYRQFMLPGNIPTTVSLFPRAPTIDIEISFNLRAVPRKYYKYLPLLPKCFDSVGLKQGSSITPYAALLTKIHRSAYAFGVDYSSNASSGREELVIKASASNVEEFKTTLRLITQTTQNSYLDISNRARLRDLVMENLASEESRPPQSLLNLTIAPEVFRHEDDMLFIALTAGATRAHWDGRLSWLLHEPATSNEIDALGTFSRQVLSPIQGSSRTDILQRLNAVEAKGLEKELVEYWKRNISSLPESELAQGLDRLTDEVQDDLRTGPTTTIQDLKELQEIVLNRRALRLDLTLSEDDFNKIGPVLNGFLGSLPSRPFVRESHPTSEEKSITTQLVNRYHVSGDYPRYIGLVIPSSTTSAIAFSSNYPGYGEHSHDSLVEVLASNLLAGTGPHSFFVEAYDAGLTYNSGLAMRPSRQTIWYYADRSPDIPSLIHLTNSVASRIPDLKDPIFVDYAFSKVFPISRSGSTFTERGAALARDLKDHNLPAEVRLFSTQMLKLRSEPDLFSQLKSVGRKSLCGILLADDCKSVQEQKASIFFFFGPENALNDIGKQLGVPLVKVWPSDFWLH